MSVDVKTLPCDIVIEIDKRKNIRSLCKVASNLHFPRSTNGMQ